MMKEAGAKLHTVLLLIPYKVAIRKISRYAVLPKFFGKSRRTKSRGRVEENPIPLFKKTFYIFLKRSKLSTISGNLFTLYALFTKALGFHRRRQCVYPVSKGWKGHEGPFREFRKKRFRGKQVYSLFFVFFLPAFSALIRFWKRLPLKIVPELFLHPLRFFHESLRLIQENNGFRRKIIQKRKSLLWRWKSLFSSRIELCLRLLC